MKRKALYLSIDYTIGTIGGLYFSKNIILFLYTLLFLYLLLSSKKSIKFLMALVFCTASLIAFEKSTKIKEIYKTESSEISLVGEIIDKQESKSSKKYVLKVIAEHTEESKKLYKGYRFIFYSKKEIEPGNLVNIKGNIDFPQESRNYKGIDNRNILLSKGIVGTIKNVKITNVIVGKGKSISEKINDCVQKILYNTMPKENADLCVALILGERNSLDDTVIQSFNSSSLSHILAISGMHIAFIASCVFFLTKHLNKQYAHFFSILFIIFFCNIVRCSESLCRAAIMLIIFHVSKITHTKSDSITSLAISSCILLMFNPFYLYSTGFTMSVCGTLGIILFYKALQSKTDSKRGLILKNYIVSQIKISISANIVLMPVIAELYNKISFIFIISAPIAGFILQVIIPTIMIHIVSSFISFSLTILTSKILIFFSNILLNLSAFFSKFDKFSFHVKSPSSIECMIYFLIISFILRRKNFNKKDKRIIKKLVLSILIIFIGGSSICKFFTNISEDFKIYFIDVGQGDSTFIVTPKNKKILIDRRR